MEALSASPRLNHKLLRLVGTGSIHVNKRLAILKAWGFRCSWCGTDMVYGPDYSTKDPRYATVDHIVPRWRGGTNEYKNLVAACNKCNSARSKADEPYLCGKPGYFLVYSIGPDEFLGFQA